MQYFILIHFNVISTVIVIFTNEKLRSHRDSCYLQVLCCDSSEME